MRPRQGRISSGVGLWHFSCRGCRLAQEVDKGAGLQGALALAWGHAGGAVLGGQICYGCPAPLQTGSQAGLSSRLGSMVCLGLQAITGDMAAGGWGGEKGRTTSPIMHQEEGRMQAAPQRGSVACWDV